MAIWAYVLFGLAAGAMLPFQAGVNAQLAGVLGSPVRAALVSFLVGTLALAALTLVAFRGSAGGDAKLADMPWWLWTGGLLGAFYVAGAIVVAPRLGAVTLLATILAGQMVASLLVDQFGWVGFAEQPISAGRIAGVALLAAGVALVRVF